MSRIVKIKIVVMMGAEEVVDLVLLIPLVEVIVEFIVIVHIALIQGYIQKPLKLFIIVLMVNVLKVRDIVIL